MARDFVLGLVGVEDTVEIKAVTNECFVDDGYVFLWRTVLGLCTRRRRRCTEGGRGKKGAFTGILSFLRYFNTSPYLNRPSTMTCVMSYISKYDRSASTTLCDQGQ